MRLISSAEDGLCLSFSDVSFNRVAKLYAVKRIIPFIL